MPVKLLVFLVVGTFFMGVPIIVLAKKYGIKIWKAMVVTVLLTMFGTIGTVLMYFIENGYWGGLSFYGAVFLVPVAFSLISFALRVPYGKILDLCAVGECIMLALMKIHCILSGCCVGRVLFVSSEGTTVLFPSREVELFVALIIFAILFGFALKKKYRGHLYALYFLFYGSTRFVLNIFREAWVSKEMLLPYGNIWSLVAVGVGVLLLLVSIKSKKRIENRCV